MSEGDWILVGVDGAGAGFAAVRYGAAEARRRGAAVRLAHVVSEIEPNWARNWAGEPTWRREMRRRARVLLAEAERQAREILDGTAVTSELLSGDRVDALVRASAGASLVVLGDERLTAWERIRTASVLSRVAAHSPVPVVAVPTGWHPAAGRARVVAAVKDCADAGGFVREALEAARARDADLVLLHAWELPATFDGDIGSGVDPTQWESAARDGLEQALKAVPVPSETFVRIDVRRGQPAWVLVDASGGADLLVIARRPHGFPFGHLGGTGRAVLRESQCPVMVLPPATAVVEDDAGEATSA